MNNMVTKKVSELEGAQLNFAVALALGDSAEVEYRSRGQTVFGRPYSTEWHSGGPIIEREQIQIDPVTRTRENHEWQAQVWLPFAVAVGPTPLIAAMRAFVESKLGNEVEVPQ